MRREARMIGAGAAIGAAGLAAAMARARPAGILSFGLCGGLHPALKAGDLVVGSAVNGIAADGAWADRLIAALPAATRGEVAGGAAMVATRQAKAILRGESGAVATDMESHLAARAAAGAGIPFAVLRAVCDSAGRALPRAAQAGFKADGGIDVWAVLRALIAAPGELADLIALAGDAAAAMRALRDARRLLGPGLGCPYLGEHLVDMA
jgi:adenosylhomocysteine nucleosidase